LFDRVTASFEGSAENERARKSMRSPYLIRSRQISVCVALLANLVISLPSFAAQKSDYTEHAEIDAQGNIYVSSDQGKLIKMAHAGPCMEATVAGDKQTFGCAVMVPPGPGDSWLPMQLEIYLRAG
jgi:hypothetical protein